MLAPSRGWILPSALALLTAAVGSSCSVLQTPVSPPVMSPQERCRLSAEGIEIDALPIRTSAQNWELFNDDLPAIGILPVWIQTRDTSTRELDLSRVKWELRSGSEVYRPIGLDRLFKQYYRRHHTRYYSVNADRNARAALAKMLFRASRLRPSEIEGGFLFFEARSAQPPDWTKGTILYISGFDFEGEKRSGRRHLELPLFHAHP